MIVNGRCTVRNEGNIVRAYWEHALTALYTRRGSLLSSRDILGISPGFLLDMDHTAGTTHTAEERHTQRSSPRNDSNLHKSLEERV